MASSEYSSSDLLPDDVIRHIISFLPIDEAIKTSRLSKRWRYLWKTISNLDFNGYGSSTFFSYEEERSFQRYVDTVLIQLDSTNPIDKLSISYHREYPTTLQKLLSFVVQHNVKDLTLNIGYSYNPWCTVVVVPRELFCCKSLEALSLCDVQFKFPTKGFVCFPNLKLLSLSGVAISWIPAQENSPACFPKVKSLCLKKIRYAGKDDCVMKLISNCPVLEDFSITRELSNDVSNVDLCIPQLTTAHLICAVNITVDVHVEAPVKYLTVSRWKPKNKISIKNLDSLIGAEIDFSFLHEYNLQGQEQHEFLKLIETSVRVKRLTLSNNAVRVIKTSNIKLPLFGNLIRLEVWLYCKDLCMVENFLNNAVNLKILVVKKWPGCRMNIRCIGEYDQWMELSNVPKCMTSSLKRVEIIDSVYCSGEIEMIKTMLNCAKVLEKLVIKPPYFMAERHNITSLHQKISAFPRASASCQFDFPSK